MEGFGPFAFWLVLAATLAGIALYALYRMTQRAAIAVDDTDSYVAVLPTSSPLAVEVATVWAAEQAEEDGPS